MNTKGTRKMLPLVMAAMLAFGAVAFAPLAARADVAGAAGPAGLPGTIAIGTASASPTEVGFNGKLWQVIGYNGTGVASASGTMTLLLKNGESYGIDNRFSSASNIKYYDSTYGSLYLKMVDIYDTSPLGEKALIQARDIDAKDNGVGTETVWNQRFWPLSTSEAQSVNSTVLAFSYTWWLRSPGNSSTYVAVVRVGGSVDTYGEDVTDPTSNFAVRPAFNLNLSSVLFTSEAASAGTASLSGLAAYTAPNGALKFTALDNTFSTGFGITETAVSGTPGGTVTLNYTGAATGTDHFIRVKLVNNAAPGQIAYAAVPVSNITAAGGSFSLALPAGMPMGTYTAYAWAEEGNGANLTNRGSTPDTFTLTVQPNVTFTPSPGSINLGNPTNLAFQANAPALLSGFSFEGVAFQNVTAGTGFGMALGLGQGVTYNPATGVLTVPAAAFGQHASIGGGSPLPAGNYRAQIQFWDGASFYFDYYVDFVATAAASASVSNVTISGTAGSALGGGQRATIVLTGDTAAGNLANTDASGWFTGLPAGITVTANASAGGSAITLTFGGTPTAVSTAQFNITIPGSILAGGNPISVAANPNARFSISGIPQPPSPLPKTGDGFPLAGLLALLGAALAGMGWLGARLRRQRKRAPCQLET